MTQTPPDLASAHRHLAADCFNQAWDLLDLPTRTPEQDRQLEALAHASVFHWTQRDDVTPRNLSIGYWQLSRVHATLRHPAEALRHARTCLEYSGDLEPFYRGYAHEAAARAHRLLGDSESAAAHVAHATSLAGQVTDAASRSALLADLATLQPSAAKESP